MSLLDAAREGLLASPKTMSPVWFYDEEGSRLFEAITELPEYYPTRTERSILARHADDIVARVGTPASLVELGAGSATKTRILLAAFLRRQPKVRFVPVDVSAEALRMAQENVEADLPGVVVEGIEARNREGLAKLDWTRPERRLVLFLGSSLGNLHPPDAADWLRDVASYLRPGDRFLLGLDRWKDERILQAAYDDAAGVTAAFNRNLLARMNRELGASFDLDAFAHEARVNVAQRRVEMHLVSRRPQRVRVPGVGEVLFEEGETIHTECSYKFTRPMREALLRQAGLVDEHAWEDEQGAFGLHLLRRA